MAAKKSTTKSTTGGKIATKAAPAAREETKSSPVAEKSASPVNPGKTSRTAKTKFQNNSKGSKGAATKTVPAGKKSPNSELPSNSAGKPDKPKAAKSKHAKQDNEQQTAKVLDSQLAFEGPLFRVLRDHIIEPGGRESHRDVIRHNGSVVILAVDAGKKKKDPWVVIERQYRHAAGQYLWELPAGKLDAGEAALEGAKRELGEETGYQAKKWSELVLYFASPGFLGESMKVFLAEGLVAGEAHPEEDEQIDFRLVKLSDLLEMIDDGKILDGKTLTSVLLYARKLGIKRKG
jgi:ADP-ribose pyrophosphatase